MIRYAIKIGKYWGYKFKTPSWEYKREDFLSKDPNKIKFFTSERAVKGRKTMMKNLLNNYDRDKSLANKVEIITFNLEEIPYEKSLCS